MEKYKPVKIIKPMFNNDLSILITNPSLLNNVYEYYFKEIKNIFLITQNDIKLFKFILKYLNESDKYKDILQIIRKNDLKINSPHIKKDIINQKPIIKNKQLIKFINFIIINLSILSENIDTTEELLNKNIFIFIKKLFVTNILSIEDINIIILLKIMLCLNNEQKNNDIKNIKEFYSIIDFFLSFIKINMTNEKISEFIKVVEFIVKNMQKILFKNNFNNIFILSRDNHLFKLIELCKISEELTNKIIPFLTYVYKNKFNIDYVFEDLSNQFILEANENLENKTNYLIAKNVFLNMLFAQEEQKDEIIIKNGFVFNDSKNNGITCLISNAKNVKFPKEGFTIVFSFCLNKSDNSKKYNIVSFYHTEENNIIMNIYIENNVLKFWYNFKVYDLFSDIKINSNYIFWMIFPKDKKMELLFYLNNSKKILPHINYPSNNFNEILIGTNLDLDNNTYIDNFEGIIGTFILFNKCLLKNRNDSLNESRLIELKGDYEMIININNKKDFIYIDRNINLILNRYLEEKNDISQYIEIIISTKSLGIFNKSDNNINNNLNNIICNYFDYNTMEKKAIYIYRFNSENPDIFNNIINPTYPFALNKSFGQFLKNRAILYLQLELFYLISVFSKTLEKNKNLVLEDLDIIKMNLYLTKILSLFFYCFNSNTHAKYLDINEINNFFYSLNDLISLYIKYGFKLKSLLLSLFVNNFQSLSSHNLLSQNCEFIFKYESYDEKDSSIFSFLFQSISTFIEGNEYFSDKNIFKFIFEKMINFDKIYLNENISQESKKTYTKLIHKLIEISLEDKDKSFSEIYIRKLKLIKEEFSINLFAWDDDNNFNNNDNIINDFDSADEDNNIKNNIISNLENKKSINKNKPIDLKLLYKYLRNLFISLDNPDNFHNFESLCLNKENKVLSFFNEIFIHLDKIKDKNRNLFKKNDLKYMELIKSLCIQFLFEIFYEKNIEELSELEQSTIESSKKLLYKSQMNLGSFNYNNSQNSLKDSFVNSSTKINPKISNDLDIRNNSLVESQNSNFISKDSFNEDFFKKGKDKIFILTKNFHFFHDFIPSPYTFSSFYLLLFNKKINNKEILKTIKNYDSIKNHELILSLKNFFVSKYYIDIIIILIERITEKNYNKFLFMDKYAFLEFSYDILNKIMMNELNDYLKKYPIRKEEIINYLFDYRDHCFYEIIINNLNNFFYLNNSIYIEGNKIINPIKKEDKSEFLQSLLNKIKDNLKNIINKTIFEIKNPFYFTLLNKLFIADNQNFDFIIEIISFIINKFATYQISDAIPYENEDSNEEKNLDKLMVIELNNKNLLLLIYKIFFYIPKRKLIIKSEKFIKIIYIYLSTFLSFSKLMYIKVLFPIEDISENEHLPEKRKGSDIKNINKKLIIEILFELILELYLEYAQDTKKIHLQIFEDLMYDLLNIKNLANHKFNKSIMEKFDIVGNKDKINHTTFYTLDKISFKKEDIFKITDGIKIKTNILQKMKNYLYKDNDKIKYYEKENKYSICLVFIVKILITIRDIDELLLKIDENNFKKSKNKKKGNEINNLNADNVYDNENNMHLKNNLIEIFNQLCLDSFTIYKKYSQYNPFIVEGKYNNGLYNYFKNYIIKEYNINEKNFNIKFLLKKLKDHIKYLRNFARVIFNFDGSIILYTYKNYMKIIRIPLKKDSVLLNIDSHSRNNSNSQYSLNSDINTNSTSNQNLCRNNSLDSKNPKIKKSRINNKNLKNLTIKKNNKAKENNSSKHNIHIIKEQHSNKSNNGYNYNYQLCDDKKFIFTKKIKFKRDIMKNYFSFYFLKLLTYDKDFMIIKKLYKYIFNDEIKNIDEYNSFKCPLKIKNYISENYYVKLFLTKDFNFFDDIFFEFSHKYAFKEKKKKRKDLNKRIQKSYVKQNSVLFPSKEILEKYDFPNFDIKNEMIYYGIKKYYCEMILNRGSIFGNILIFENGILFQSDCQNDIKTKDKLIEFACSSLEYDCLDENKKIFIEFDEINEIINRYFCFCSNSQEIFLKNGKSFLFNFFTEKNSEEIFEIFKSKKIQKIIKNPRDFFEKKNYSKNWKENKITTYEYLLLLNKFSSRSYNDTNQYPIMPWIHLSDNCMRNFDLPISLQNERVIEAYRKKFMDYFTTHNKMFHNNHYSTSAYVCFYLMRINPFSNNMVKFQSNEFDIPDRQFTSMKGTLELCEQCNNNREAIPEIFEIPEIYYNINYNDFGRLKDKTRIHNLCLEPYAKSSIDYCYKLKHRTNYDIETNKNIQKWLDFIFGVNQWSNNPKDNLLRQFSEYSYTQNINIKKIINELKKQKTEEEKIFDIIRTNVGYAINFGQCPPQIFSEPHPIKNDILFNNIESKDKNDITIKIKNRNNNYKVLYFYKNKNNNNIVCLLNEGFVEIYISKKKKENEYELFKSIKPKGLLNQNILYKYYFCEFNTDLFIFGGFLDKTIKIFWENNEITYLLDSYITAIIKIKNYAGQFVSGHQDGFLTKWRINITNYIYNANNAHGKNSSNNQSEIVLKKLLSMKSNKSYITCLSFHYKLNIILSSDNDSIIIRNYYNFEFLSLIILNKNNNLINKVIDMKISNYNFVYILIEQKEKENKIYELQCYTLNGTFANKIKGNFTEFELTNSGNVIIPDLNNRLIKVLRPYDFFLINSNSYPFTSSNKNPFHIFYENPNTIYLSIEENDTTTIKKLQINKSKEIYFI